jgi:transposase-like protein
LPLHTGQSATGFLPKFDVRTILDPRPRRTCANASPSPHTAWHLDEVYLKIDGRMVYLWRAVDAEGEVLDVLVQSRRNKRAALKLMRKLLKKYGFVPDKLVTDDLRSYTAAASDLGMQNAMSAVDGATIERRIRIKFPSFRRIDLSGWAHCAQCAQTSSNTCHVYVRVRVRAQKSL